MARKVFIRTEGYRFKRLGEKWRKPRGIHNKIRIKKKGEPSPVEVGYRSPRNTRGLHPSGFRDVLVRNLAELNNLDPKQDAVRIASSVGKKKRIEIMKKCLELGLKVLNPIEIPEEKEVKESESKEPESTSSENTEGRNQ